MRASVVVPCFNSLRWLPATVDSLLSQTFDDYEVVLVDDGGGDDLAGWVKQRGDDRLRVVRQENAGVSAARNRGVRESSGALVAFCDSDDLWTPDALERLIETYDADPQVGLVYGWYDVIDALGQPTGRIHTSEIEGEVWERLLVTNPVATSIALVPRAVFEAVGGFEVNRESFPIDVEDWALWIRIAEHHQVAVVREVLCHHRRHDTNSSSDVASLDAAYRHLLTSMFERRRGEPGYPADRLQELQGVALGRIEMILAWHSLNDDGNAEAARAYRRSARRHSPGLRRRPEYWRLGAAVAVLSVLGRSGYAAVRSTSSRIRRVVPIGASGTNA